MVSSGKIWHPNIPQVFPQHLLPESNGTPRTGWQQGTTPWLEVLQWPVCRSWSADVLHVYWHSCKLPKHRCVVKHLQEQQTITLNWAVIMCICDFKHVIVFEHWIPAWHWGCPQDFIALLWGLEGSTSRSASKEADRVDRTFFNSPHSRYEHTPSLPWFAAGLMLSVLRCLHVLCGGTLCEAVYSLWLCTDYSLCAYLKHTKSAVMTTICTYLQSRPAFQPQAG